MDDGAVPARPRRRRPARVRAPVPVGRAAAPPALRRAARRTAASRGIRTLVTTNGTLLDDRRIAGPARRPAGAGDGVGGRGPSDPRGRARHPAPRARRTRSAASSRRGTPAGSTTAVDVSMVVAPETERAVGAFRREFEGTVDRVQTIPLLVRGERRTRCREPWRGGLVVLQDGADDRLLRRPRRPARRGRREEERLADVWNGAEDAGAASRPRHGRPAAAVRRLRRVPDRRRGAAILPRGAAPKGRP